MMASTQEGEILIFQKTYMLFPRLPGSGGMMTMMKSWRLISSSSKVQCNEIHKWHLLPTWINVFTLMGHIYLWSRGFLRSNIPSDYSIARGRILNDVSGLLCLTKPTLVTITRCWGWWRRLCNTLNIYLSCSCWCECSLTRFSIPTRGFTTEPSMKETTTMLELIVFSRSLRASVVRASEWALWKMIEIKSPCRSRV